MRTKLTCTSLISDRFDVSDRATATIASGVLHDFGILSDSDKSKVIDKSKIRKEKIKIRKQLFKEDFRNRVVYGIYFDGRKDNTLVEEKIGSKMYRRERKEEHISLISEPGSQYIGHVTPKKETGNEIAECIFSFIKDRDVDISAIEAVGCDGTATNTRCN